MDWIVLGTLALVVLAVVLLAALAIVAGGRSPRPPVPDDDVDPPIPLFDPDRGKDHPT